MTERLLGMETEYGLSVILRSGARGSTESAANDLVHLARGIPHLRGMHSGGLFLANGSRFYVDCGSHPELATPECANPWDVCRYVQAGDRILADLGARLVERDREVARTLILKSNVDYKSRATWGCHESYLHRSVDQSTLSRHIIPHLASRIIFSGAGGFDCFSPGIEFMVSPRVAHLSTDVSGDSTGDRRGIFHTRDEPLCSHGYGRLHLLCGESVAGHTGAWLKVATTALVVALIEAGQRPGDAVALRHPVAAMRTFSSDPTCRHTARLAAGREASAIEIQRHYLALAESRAGESFMPPWAGDVCRHWRAMLDRLEHGAAAVARTLDWAIKLTLFQNHARRRNTTLEALTAWTSVLNKLSAARAVVDCGSQPLSTALVTGRNSPLAPMRKELAPLLRERGLSWDGLDGVLALRLELFEIDTRFGLLGTDGIFAALDREGVLEHAFPGVDNIPHARDNPPSSGRAALRGACIRRVADHNGRFAADWDGVWDIDAGHQLDLADPFCSAERWISHHTQLRVTANTDRMFREGRYADVLDQVTRGAAVSTDDTALSLARLGRREDALALIESNYTGGQNFHRLAMVIWIYSTGLVPDVEALAPLIAEGDRLMEESPASPDEYSTFVFLCGKALFFMHTGRQQLAEPLFVALLANPLHTVRPRMFSRAQCYLAELHRMVGRVDESRQLVERAMLTHRAESLPGDAASHSLPLLAKLEHESSAAAAHFRTAEETHRLQRNDLGLAHTLCLRARRLRNATDRAEIERLFTCVPVLTTCRTAHRILSEWDSWVAPATGDRPIDFWGL